VFRFNLTKGLLNLKLAKELRIKTGEKVFIYVFMIVMSLLLLCAVGVDAYKIYMGED
jgi:hypothetical protein